jgi:ABC-type multidrug transport system fused ATPase/permease subunit
MSRYQQVAELSGGKVPSKSEMDSAEANLKRAEANQASARASVTQARANLQSDETNLGKASIRSPIDGVVLARQVDPGQTVAASFQAPVLFTLAEDLAKMELQVDVDEADVGQVKAGQKAMFSVDAWPGRQYAAVITRVGFGSQVKDGVVSYLTVLEVDNGDLSLRPGMTGTAEITTLTRENALLVPNAALRFTPASDVQPQKKSGGNVMSFMMPRMPRQAPRASAKASDAGTPVCGCCARARRWRSRSRPAPATAADRDYRRRAGGRDGSDHRGARPPAMSDQALIRLSAITKTYGSGQAAFQALKGIDLAIDAGDFVAIMGPSGSGKSTAMNILGCLDTPSSGSYEFEGVASNSCRATSARCCGAITSASCSRASTCWRVPLRWKTSSCR